MESVAFAAAVSSRGQGGGEGSRSDSAFASVMKVLPRSYSRPKETSFDQGGGGSALDIQVLHTNVRTGT
jgi:hypothetical protein